MPSTTDHGRYQAITERNVEHCHEWKLIPPELQEGVRVVSQVLPFRTNRYVMRELIDWSRVPDDPIYQLVFPQPGMLLPDEYRSVRDLLYAGEDGGALAREVERIRLELNPQPDGQLTHNVPELDGRPYRGLQHKYQDTVLFFPSRGQTCHAYCTYCFRWAQFVGMPEIRFESRGSRDLVRYLTAHPEVTDVLVTGGDPMIMKTQVLRHYLEPLLEPGLEHLRTIRLGTKALAYWPQRFVTDTDADDCLRLFEQIVAAGKQLAFMAHVSHPVELAPEIVREAIRRIRSTGAVIRTQAPLIRHVNDDARLWSQMWTEGVNLGMIPYYMFVERDTGARSYFEVPLARCHAIFQQAYESVPGLARTVRGPSMSAFPGKVRVLGTVEIGGQRVFALDMLRARKPEWVGRPFFARYDPDASWLDELRPAFGEERFFFEEVGEREVSAPGSITAINAAVGAVH